jgi:hypothetical protein
LLQASKARSHFPGNSAHRGVPAIAGVRSPYPRHQTTSTKISALRAENGVLNAPRPLGKGERRVKSRNEFRRITIGCYNCCCVLQSAASQMQRRWWGVR